MFEKPKQFYKPRAPSTKVEMRKERFDRLKRTFLRAERLIPGAPDIALERLAGSTLPDDLRGFGCDVREVGEGERILHSAII